MSEKAKQPVAWLAEYSYADMHAADSRARGRLASLTAAGRRQLIADARTVLYVASARGGRQ